MPTSLPPTTTQPIPPESITILKQEHNLLRALHYRHKNQHRHSIWFRWLRMFKRSLAQCILEISSCNAATAAPVTTASTQDERGKKVKPKTPSTDDGKRLKISDTRNQHLAKFRNVIIPGAYTAFTHLITSTQYAGLGMVLLGILAKVWTIVGMSDDELEEEKKDEEEEEENVGEQVLEQLEREIDVEDEGEFGEKVDRGEIVGYGRDINDMDEDVGEVVKREDVEVGVSKEVDPKVKSSLSNFATTGERQHPIMEETKKVPVFEVVDGEERTIRPIEVDDQAGQVVAKKQKTTTTTTVTKKTTVTMKKKRKKANPIDELFGSL